MSNASSSSKQSSSSRRSEYVDNSILVHQILPTQFNVLCFCLDGDINWEILAKEMGYKDEDRTNFRQKIKKNDASPVKLLLSDWSQYNHTVTELFMVLHKLGQYAAMNYLKDFVDQRFHRLIKAKVQPTSSANQPNLTALLSSASISSESSPPLDMHALANHIPQIDYDELAKATNNWCRQRILGRGGYGTVFKGSWKNTDVAIKRIEYRKASDDSKQKALIEMRQSLNELRFLNSCRHDNVLPLYGYSINGSERCLVYQFMAGGSLQKRLQLARLQLMKPLTFDERKGILAGTALGIQYLHTFSEKPLIHGDIKPDNILLDPYCMPKIGDFGLVREGAEETMKISMVCGTRPYLPVDYIRSYRLTTKIDTYSYGVVLFELLTALHVYDKGRAEPFLANHMKTLNRDSATLQSVMDATIDVNDTNLDVCMELFDLALLCTEERAKNRPDMTTVYRQLKKIFG